MRKSNLNHSVLLMITVYLFFFASCKKKEESKPDYGSIDFGIPNSTFTLYGSKNDWLNETNALFTQTSKKGDFTFDKEYPTSTYYYDLYDSAYIHNNTRFVVFDESGYSFENVSFSKSHTGYGSSYSFNLDEGQIRYMFLGNKPVSNWNMIEYGGIGVNAPACAKLRTLKIFKDKYITITDGTTCTAPESYTFGIVFYKETEQYWQLGYSSGTKLISSSGIRLYIMEKKAGVATKIKLTDDASPTKNYEIYALQ